MDPNGLRRLDFSLDPELLAVRKTFAALLVKESPPSVVRDAQPLGYDAGVWKRLCALGAASMALPEEVGGDGAGILALALVAEEIGRNLVPVPLLEHVVAGRLLAAANDATSGGIVQESLHGSRLLTIAPAPLVGRQLVAAAAVAQDVVALRGESVVVVSAAKPRDHVENQAGLPSAWVDPGTESIREVSLPGGAEAFERALCELKILYAAALVGLTEAALRLGVEFSKTRRTMGVPIGELQGVAFPLSDVEIGVTGARNLALRAAWFLDHEPDSEIELPYAAHAFASQVATHGVQVAAHVQGGLGFTVEADASLYFLRAKGWSRVAGDPSADLQRVGEITIAHAAVR